MWSESQKASHRRSLDDQKSRCGDHGRVPVLWLKWKPAIGFHPINRKFSSAENPFGKSILRTPSNPIPMTPKPEAHPDSVNGRLADYLATQKEAILPPKNTWSRK